MTPRPRMRTPVSLDDLPSLEQLAAAKMPMFFRGWRPGDGVMTAEQLPQLKDLSLNDWYGHGVLVGLGVALPLRNDPDAMHYAGKSACANQYLRGIRDGREINSGEALRMKKAFEQAEGG